VADNFNIKLSELSALNKSIVEANAASQGISPQQYLSNRGGVNPVTGMFGDSFNPTVNLTDAEYKAALAGKVGAAQGEAINKAQQEKYQKSLAASGTAYRAPDGTYYASESEARAAGAISGAGGTSGASGSLAGTSEQISARQSAYDLLLAQFSEYGLQSLVEPLRNLITQNVSPSEFTIRLRETEAYKKRFAANADRIKKGLTALNEATYLGLEDKYQGIMRNYDLPSTYYSKDSMGRQEGFEKLIANDVSATELEDRILTAQNRVINAPTEVTAALKQFYPGITNGDILAYTLDPEKALTDIKRKVTAAEIGGAAIGAGLATDVTRAEELAKYGVTAATARQGYQAAVPLIERGRQLSAFYEESPYTQATAEEELFNLSGAAGAAEKRKKLSSLETAQFGGRSGITGGALARDRAGAY